LNKVSLSAIRFGDWAEIIPAQAEIQGQPRSDLPVILEVCGEVTSSVIGFADVGCMYLVRASHKPDSTVAWIGGCLWCQQELCATGLVAGLARNTCKVAVEVEFTSRVSRLQRIEVNILILDAHLETVFPIDLGKVIHNLESLADFVGGQVVVATQLI